MGNTVADTGNDPAAREPLPSEGAENSSDPAAALPATEKAIVSELNEGAHKAADEPIPEPAIPLHPLAKIVPTRDDASIRELARHIGPNDPIDPMLDRLLAADSPVGRTSAIEMHNPPKLGSGDTSQRFQVEAVGAEIGAPLMVGALRDARSGIVVVAALDTAPTQLPGSVHAAFTIKPVSCEFEPSL